MNSSQNKILVLAATNRPFDLDEAALRRLTRRIYLPLPDPASRKALLLSILKKGSRYELSEEELMGFAQDL